MSNKNWVPLHAHSHYSLLDGYSKIADYVQYCKDQGYTAAALTDHGVISGHIEMMKECEKAGIKAILGIEFYVCEGDAKDKSPANKGLSHLVVLAKNLDGWKELVALVSESNKEENKYYKPRVDKAMMKKYLGNGNHFCITGHPGSTLADVIYPDNKIYDAKSVEEARSMLPADWKQKTDECIDWHVDIFGENFRGEIQLIDKDRLYMVEVLADCIRDRCKEKGLKTVATADSHYVRRSDAVYQRILLCSAFNRTMGSIEYDLKMGKDVPLGGFFKSDNYHVPTLEEMAALHTDEELANAVEIAELCENYSILSEPQLPFFEWTEGMSEKDYLRKLCQDGWHKVPKDKEEEYRARLEFELGVIEGKDLVGYFLIVWDIINFVRKKEWLTPTGRGSAAGCLVSYIIGITTVDPIKHDLLFERFLNPGRKGLPDIDIDVPSSHREEVIAYIKDKYGEAHVCQMATFGSLMGRSAIKEVIRLEGAASATELNEITEHIPDEAEIADELAEMDDKSIIRWTLQNRPKKLERWCTLNEDGTLSGPYAKYFETAMAIEGTYKSQGKHAAGIIISSQIMADVCPILSDKSGATVGGFSMNDMESCGHVKFDILGVAVLDKIAETIPALPPGRDINDFDDPLVWDSLGDGDIKGVFQLERQKRWTKKLKPKNIDHLAGLLSVIRPGTLEVIEEGKSMTEHYIDRKNELETTPEIHPVVDPILNETYGVLVYQETAMSLARAVAGFTLQEADDLRKACLTGDSLMLTKNGPKKIEDLVNKNIQVLTVRNGKNVYSKTNRIFYSGQKEVFKLSTSNGYHVECSGDHEIFTQDGWKQLKDCTTNDFVVIPNQYTYPGYSDTSINKAILTAYFIGEGCYTNKCHPKITNSDPWILNLLRNILTEEFGQDSYNEQVYQNGVTDLNFKNRALQWIVDNFIKNKSRNKFLNISILGSYKSACCAFLGSYFSAEGTVDSESGSLSISSTSESICRNIQMLLLRIGVHSSFYVKNGTYKNEPYVSYEVNISNRDDVLKFTKSCYEYICPNKITSINNIQDLQFKNSRFLVPACFIQAATNNTNFNSKDIFGIACGSIYNSNITYDKAARLNQIYNSELIEDILSCDYKFVKINSIEPTGIKDVYDFSINEECAYVNGILVHNCGKKDTELMAKVKVRFLEGAKELKAVPEDVAVKIFEWIEKSQRYSFNASHAYSYAYNAYHTAYCKAHAPLKFYEVWLNHAKSKPDPITEMRELINDAKIHGFEVYGPSLNRFYDKFTMNELEGSITFGISGVKGVGAEAKKLIDLRNELGDDFAELNWVELLFHLNEHKIKKTAVNALIEVGAFNGPNNVTPRKQMLYEYEVFKQLTAREINFILSNIDSDWNLIDYIQYLVNNFKLTSSRIIKIMDIISTLENPPYELEDTPDSISNAERDLMGLAITDYTLYDSRTEVVTTTDCLSLLRKQVRGEQTIAGTITDVREHTIKKVGSKLFGQKMCFLALSDATGEFKDITIFPDLYKTAKPMLLKDNTILISGSVEERTGQYAGEISLIGNRIIQI